MRAKEWIENIIAHPNWGTVEIEWEAVDEIQDMLNFFHKEYPQYNATQIADEVIHYCLERNIYLNYLKLHKVLGFLQLFYLVYFDQFLFKDDIYVYGYGISVPIISKLYSHNGGLTIRKTVHEYTQAEKDWFCVKEIPEKKVDELVVKRITPFLQKLAPLSLNTLDEMNWKFDCVNEAYNRETILDMFAMRDEFKKCIMSEEEVNK